MVINKINVYKNILPWLQMAEAFDRSKHLPSFSPTLIHELFLTVKLRKPKHINYDGFVKLYAEKDITCELKFQFILKT